MEYDIYFISRHWHPNDCNSTYFMTPKYIASKTTANDLLETMDMEGKKIKIHFKTLYKINYTKSTLD